MLSALSRSYWKSKFWAKTLKKWGGCKQEIEERMLKAERIAREKL